MCIPIVLCPEIVIEPSTPKQKSKQTSSGRLYCIQGSFTHVFMSTILVIQIDTRSSNHMLLHHMQREVSVAS